jgi:hypothetical protein
VKCGFNYLKGMFLCFSPNVFLFNPHELDQRFGNVVKSIVDNNYINLEKHVIN